MRRDESVRCLQVWKPLLTISQLNSLRLILEWWEDRIQPERLGREARRVIAALYRQHPIEALEQGKEFGWAKLRRSRYHEQIYRVFLFEFLPEHHCYDWYIGDREMISSWLAVQRSYAVDLAAMQRVTSACLDDIKSMSLPANPKNPEEGSDASPTRLSEFVSQTPPATLNPCPWLKTEAGSSERPFYLWDVKARQTIEAIGVEDCG